MNIAIVTGCAGFIGLNFIKRLLADNWYVYGIDKLTYAANVKDLQSLIISYPDTFNFMHEDIATVAWLPEADVIFNFAAESDVDNSNKDSSTFVQSNIAGVQNLLQLINNRIVIKTDKPLFFHISTDEVYGDIESGYFSETSILSPSNPYSATKAAADLLIQSWSKTHGLDYIIVRPSNNYGPLQYPEKLIPLTVKRLLRGKKVKLHNNGQPVRTWTHVEDTINAIICIYKKGKHNTIYNISSMFEQKNIYTVEEIVKGYLGYTPVDMSLYIDNNYKRAGQDVRYAISCEPLIALGWTPSKVFSVEITHLIEHYKKRFVW